MTIRAASPTDGDAIWTILSPILRAGETYALPRDWAREAALAFWFSADHEVFVADDDGAIVGTYFLCANHLGGGAHVANAGYATAQNAQGKGVARAMCEHSLEYARGRGFRAMQFNFVIATNTRAVALWQRMDFSIVGTLPGAFAHPTLGDVDAYVMYRSLDEKRAAAAATKGVPLRADELELVDRLADRAPSETTTVLLELARRQAARKGPAEIRAQYKRDPFVWPSSLDLRTTSRLDALALAAAPDFDAVLLSPLAPLGCCVAVSPSHQDRIVSTLRCTEVVSDPTNVLALECARRLAERADDVRLCTVHQVVRAQRFEATGGKSQHFRMFALAEAGRARADHAFEVDAFVRHVCVFWRLLDAFEASGSRFPNRTAKLLVAEPARPIQTRLRARLEHELPQLRIEDGALESGYYAGLRLLLGADDASGNHVNLSDTGLFAWAEKLTSDRRFRFVASGFGLQLVPLVFLSA